MSYDSLSLSEHHIYGSSRLGIQQYSDTAYLSVYKEGELLENALSTRQPWYSYTYNDWILPTATKPISTTGLLSRYTSDMRSSRILGYRQYELTDHLGNATATILDRRTGYGDAGGYYTGYHADLVSALDYYPFGMPMPGRSVDSYRFGFNGQEKVNEIIGEGNGYSFTYRGYDSRIGRFISVDPLAKYYPYYKPYQFAGNKVINSVDIDGLEDAKFDGMERNDWIVAKQLYPNNLDKQFEYVHGNQRARGIGAAMGAAALLTIYTGGRALPLLQRVSAFALMNQELVVGLGGLTASLLDPNHANDYPRGLDDVGRGVKLLFKSKGVEKFILNTSKFDYFFR